MLISIDKDLPLFEVHSFIHSFSLLSLLERRRRRRQRRRLWFIVIITEILGRELLLQLLVVMMMMMIGYCVSVCILCSCQCSVCVWGRGLRSWTLSSVHSVHSFSVHSVLGRVVRLQRLLIHSRWWWWCVYLLSPHSPDLVVVLLGWLADPQTTTTTRYPFVIITIAIIFILF